MDLPPSIYMHCNTPNPFILYPRERLYISADRIIVSRDEIFRQRQEFLQRGDGFRRETLQKAPLTFEITVCAAHDRTQPRSPPTPPPNVFRSECTCTQGAHKSKCATWQRTRTSHKRLSAQVCMYVCMWQQRGDLSVSARPCMQMHQIKCNYTRRKFTLGLHPPLCWCASFAQNSTSDKLHGEEKERPEFVLFRRRRQR
jgi:hypothetical protein